jgi:hypothetical protein
MESLTYPPEPLQFVAPVPQKFGEVSKDIGPAIEGAVNILTKLGDGTKTGTKTWGTDWFAFWENPMICESALPSRSCSLESPVQLDPRFPVPKSKCNPGDWHGRGERG